MLGGNIFEGVELFITVCDCSEILDSFRGSEINILGKGEYSHGCGCVVVWYLVFGTVILIWGLWGLLIEGCLMAPLGMVGEGGSRSGMCVGRRLETYHLMLLRVLGFFR